MDVEDRNKLCCSLHSDIFFPWFLEHVLLKDRCMWIRLNYNLNFGIFDVNNFWFFFNVFCFCFCFCSFLFLQKADVDRLNYILTIKDSALNVPRNLEARRRLQYFTTSLFMTMPAPPAVRKMFSFRSVVHGLLYIELEYRRVCVNPKP